MQIVSVTDALLRENVTIGAKVIHAQRLKSDPGGNLLS
ncbi:integrase [Escherichia coli]|nr:integrase [Escherichia coli]